MSIRRFFLGVMIMMILSACNRASAPVPTNDVTVILKSGSTAYSKSYEIPKGIFRGVTWPTNERKSFKIWVIDNDEEKYFDIPCPTEFINYKKEVTDNWIIEKKSELKDKMVYFAKRKDNKKILEIRLPVNKSGYNYSVLNNDKDDEIIIFMSTSENVIDFGILGYVVIK